MLKLLTILSSAVLVVSGTTVAVQQTCFNYTTNNNLAFTSKFTNMYVLGDSLSDVGTLAGATTDFLSYHNFISSGKFAWGNPFWNNHFCTGENASEHLADKLGFKLAPAWYYDGGIVGSKIFEHVGNSYAFGGSQADDTDSSIWSSIKQHVFDKFSLEMQYGELIHQHKLLSSDLVLIESSNNDIFNALDVDSKNDTLTQSDIQYAQAAVEAEGSVIGKLLADGVKNIVVTNVGNIAKTPRYLFDEHERTTALVEKYNQMWSEMMQGFNKKNVHGFDLFSEFNKDLQKAAKNGMDVVNPTVQKMMDSYDLVKDFNAFGDGVIKMKWDNFLAANDKQLQDYLLQHDVFLDEVHPTEWFQNQVGIDLSNFVLSWN